MAYMGAGRSCVDWHNWPCNINRFPSRRKWVSWSCFCSKVLLRVGDAGPSLCSQAEEGKKERRRENILKVKVFRVLCVVDLLYFLWFFYFIYFFRNEFALHVLFSGFLFAFVCLKYPLIWFSFLSSHSVFRLSWWHLSIWPFLGSACFFHFFLEHVLLKWKNSLKAERVDGRKVSHSFRNFVEDEVRKKKDNNWLVGGFMNGPIRSWKLEFKASFKSYYIFSSFEILY